MTTAKPPAHAARRSLACVVMCLASCLAACQAQPDRKQRRKRYDGPTLALPSALSSATQRATTSWAAELGPAHWGDSNRQWQPNDRVWAAVPRAGRSADVAVFRMVGRFDGVISLLDRLGQRVDGVPPQLVHRASRIGKLRVGDVVLCDAVTAPGQLALVVDLEGAITVVHKWGTTTQRTAVDHAEPPREGVAPLAYVSYERDGRRNRGLVLALANSWAWVRDSSGTVRKVPRASLSALTVPTSLSIGERVEAFSWEGGARLGLIAQERMPSLSYEVVHEDGSRADYFFAQLIRNADAPD